MGERRSHRGTLDSSNDSRRRTTDPHASTGAYCGTFNVSPSFTADVWATWDVPLANMRVHLGFGSTYGGFTLPRHNSMLATVTNLTDATKAFAASEFCAQAFGEAFRDHYAASRFNEVAAFEVWKTQRITDFEWQRYFI